MSPDEFDHPELRDPEWARVDRRAVRQARGLRLRDTLTGAARRARRPRPHAKAWTAAGVACLLAAGGIFFIAGQREPEPPGTHADAPGHEVDPARPFERTPAQGWDEGSAGIAVPEATAVGDFSAEEVADAYREVSAVLVASRIDRAVLEDGDLDGLLSLLAPATAEWAEEQLSAPVWPIELATRIDPSVSLSPVGPRTKGTLTAEPGEQPGELRVLANYTVAYAFAGPEDGEVETPLDIVSALRVDEEYAVRTGQTWYPEDRGVSYGGGESLTYSMACTPLVEKGWLAPQYVEAAPLGMPDPTRPPEYFDPANPMPEGDNCRAEGAGE
ncbi:hypothetical protein FFT09_12700 [Saccharomonospora piscinae]|uniref:hypothetical protein n=1 Tax=Saccharomonospora piscinae TaxID=687388 RepID=UPI0011064963|nr:hypothetical protein [Saccharomonospora piscinae]TLW91778.1 hypothetical protein FFT09_12700 [Saccharomonospora piscinae]